MTRCDKRNGGRRINRLPWRVLCCCPVATQPLNHSARRRDRGKTMRRFTRRTAKTLPILGIACLLGLAAPPGLASAEENASDSADVPGITSSDAAAAKGAKAE